MHYVQEMVSNTTIITNMFDKMETMKLIVVLKCGWTWVFRMNSPVCSQFIMPSFESRGIVIKENKADTRWVLFKLLASNRTSLGITFHRSGFSGLLRKPSGCVLFGNTVNNRGEKPADKTLPWNGEATIVDPLAYPAHRSVPPQRNILFFGEKTQSRRQGQTLPNHYWCNCWKIKMVRK